MKKKKSRKGNKFHLTSKICLVCKKEFTRRKKREKNWKDVLYCSKKCKGRR